TLIVQFYSYLWLRKNDLPYYVGKGQGNRAFKSVKGHRPPKDKTRIAIFPQDSEAEAFASEIALIELFGRKDLGTGCLINLTDGGEGPAGHRFSEEAKRRMSVIHSNPSAEFRAKISATLTGRPLAEETKAKMSKVRRGRIKSAAWRAKISAAHIGKLVSDAARQNMSRAASWRPPQSEATREKHRRNGLGRRHSPE